jgi:hypothetical protein
MDAVQLEQALPLGVSWIVKRSPRNQTASAGPAWAFLPYQSNGHPMAMNLIVNDKHAVEAIGRRIDTLWAAWAEERSSADIRHETLAELERALDRITTRH